jgi:dipeptidyl-peptidase-4
MRRFHFFLLVFCCLALAPALVAAQDKMLTLEEIFGPEPAKRVNFNGSVPQVRWLKDGANYLQIRREGLLKVNALTGESAPFVDTAKIAAALQGAGVPADDAKGLAGNPFLSLNPAQNGALFDHKGDLYYAPLDGGAAKRLTNTKDEELEGEFSPNGAMVSFVRGYNLYVVDLATGREKALTRDGNANLLNGYLDWVYEEELYGRGNKRGYWWSPDSKSIAYLRTDEAPVPKFVVVDHIPTRQLIEDTPYPKAGDPNPLVKLGVADVKSGKSVWADNKQYKPEDLLISRVAWSPDSLRVIYQAQDRAQTFLDMNAANARDGKVTRLFQETTKAWVEADDNPFWLKDGSFLWRSERTGWKHIYHFAADGKLLKQVTDGPWEARTLDAVDEAGGWIYFTATKDSHIGENAYRVKTDGSNLTRLTAGAGAHAASFNADGSLFFDRWSDINTPPQMRLYKGDGSLLRVLEENKSGPATLGKYKLGKAEFVQVKTRDGFPMEAMMIKPPDFDPNKKYPVWSYTYSGPHAPQVRNAWGGARFMWHQMLAQKGYIIWVCDNRTASGKGAESVWPGYKRLGELELQDLEDGVNYLKAQPFVDGSRIGLWGWSYGGFMTSYALTHSNSFKVGIAGGSVTAWELYDSIYTERYMQTPQKNPEGYRRTAPLRSAANLNGKLLLIHGAIDDNVHMQNTMKFAYELQKAGKPFNLMAYPKARHGVTDPAQVKHMYSMMTDFILGNL